MPYCIQTDITNIELTGDELIQLTDDEKLGAVNSARVAAAIQKADAEIDGYCKGRYTVPFSPVPDEVKFFSATIAVYWLFRRRQRVTESVLDKYVKVLAKLKDIAEGRYSLNGATVASSGMGSTVGSTVKPTFTRSQLDGDGNLVGDAGSMDTW